MRAESPLKKDWLVCDFLSLTTLIFLRSFVATRGMNFLHGGEWFTLVLSLVHQVGDGICDDIHLSQNFGECATSMGVGGNEDLG